MRLPENWSDIKTKDFIAIYKIITSDEYTSQTERLIDIAATLLDVPVAQLDNLALTALYKLDFLLHPEAIATKIPKRFYLKGKMYKPLLNIQQEWTGGNYIDVSEYTKDPEKIIPNMHLLMAAVCLPCNWLGRIKKYNGKEAEERAKLFYEHLPVTITYPITLFFLQQLAAFNARYPNLFGQAGGGANNRTTGHAEQWGWYMTLDTISNGRREMWDYFTNMNVVAFMNYLAYYKDKVKQENENLKQAAK